MIIEVKVPDQGESITQVVLSGWLVEDGQIVEKDEEIAEIDSDKAILTIYATENGKITFIASQGDTLSIGDLVCSIDTTAVAEKPVEKPLPIVVKEEVVVEKPKVLEEVLPVKEAVKASPSPVKTKKPDFSREVSRQKMTMLRTKLSERLVAVKNQTAMLTTFNEINMSALLAIKKQYNDSFKEKYGVGIGFMSFFTKAVTEALRFYPNVNAMIEKDEIITPEYADISIAVSGPKGLIVPVIRNAESLSLAEIEIKIKELAAKAKDNKITLEEMEGGTFTITNGGVFGSMMSTPIINPPQSAILGMHNIIERPVAINGEVKIQPMMYIALSYDHRVIDGRESVGFLIKVKEMIENPVKMLFKGNEPLKELLGI
ncbi:MAG: dihydrolipoyllysine-residue succinyltransferase [Bacteroidetes bacterium]|nr:dihydrolipoyllysine-residue succinyltransferase [Bacteroidota bacterium]